MLTYILDRPLDEIISCFDAYKYLDDIVLCGHNYISSWHHADMLTYILDRAFDEIISCFDLMPIDI